MFYKKRLGGADFINYSVSKRLSSDRDSQKEHLIVKVFHVRPSISKLSKTRAEAYDLAVLAMSSAKVMYVVALVREICSVSLRLVG